MRRLRVPLALLLGAAAVTGGLLASGEDTAETVTAVRVAESVAAGEQLSPGMLEEVRVDAAAVPEGHVTSPEGLEGRRPAAPLPAGAVVHEDQLVGPGLLHGQESGTVAVPVRPADTAMVPMLRAGQQVDVLLSEESSEAGSSRAVAEGAPVLWTPNDEEENWLPGASEAGSVVIVAVDAGTAGEIAQATHEGRLHLSLVSG